MEFVPQPVIDGGLCIGRRGAFEGIRGEQRRPGDEKLDIGWR
jgi:hypothetical protein